MEAASRPPMEPLADLPLEEPAERASPASAARAPGPGAAQKGPAPPAAAPEATQTLLKPEFLIGGDEPTIPAVGEAPVEAPQALELDPDAPLTLEDNFEVDQMLSAAPHAPSRTAPAATPRPAPPPDELALIPDSRAESVRPAVPTAKPASPSPAAPARTGDAAAPPAPALVPL